MKQNTEKRYTFNEFWAERRTTSISALVITMVMCLLIGWLSAIFSTLIWILIGLVFWVFRTWLSYRDWRKKKKEEEEERRRREGRDPGTGGRY